jgi:SHS2 domain-containing protein
VSDISETRVIAQLAGEPYDEQRHAFESEVKAVTYHQLEVRHDGEGWRGRVILDL